ncbi:hypothetical protein EEL31_09345 [Brevibacillus laterosporus]|nr:hypothetical protein [Brevibacillus laterosporus]TPG68709.1 hypothetical protein EEL31_09345 [Brevibacillus laterosporus]
MKLANYELVFLYKILYSLELSGKKSRMRTRFCKLLEERVNEINDERDKLFRQYAKYDEQGQIVTEKNEQGLLEVVFSDPVSLDKELEILIREDFILDEVEERKETLLTVSDIILNIDMQFSKQDAAIYDRCCEAFENLSYTK